VEFKRTELGSLGSEQGYIITQERENIGDDYFTVTHIGEDRKQATISVEDSIDAAKQAAALDHDLRMRESKKAA
jgi:hypothetical protein